MSEKNITEVVNVNREPEVNGGRCKMEKTRSGPHTITLTKTQPGIHLTQMANLLVILCSKAEELCQRELLGIKKQTYLV